MYLTNNVIKSLRIYMLILCFIFFLWFVLSYSGVHFQNAAWDYYDKGVAYETPSNYFTLATENFEISSMLLLIGSIFLVVGVIMTFIITFVITRLKMKENKSYMLKGGI